MSSLSVQGRITLIAGCCLLASAVALVASSLFNAARMQEQVLTSTTLEGQHAAENWSGHGSDPGSPGDQLPR